MNRTSILFAICAFISLNLNLYSQLPAESKKNIGIHYMPLTLIDYSPRFRAGAEIRANKKIGYCLELGYGNYWLNKNRLLFDGMIWNKGYQFLEVRPELKYYFQSPFSEFNWYTSLEVFYIRLTDRMINDYYHYDQVGNIIRFDQADYSKDKLGTHIKAGIRANAGSNFDLDLYAGVGMAWRKIHYHNVINPVYGIHDHYEWVIPFHKYEGEKMMFHITLGCKVGIVF